MRIIIAIPILAFVLILQSAVFSRILLLRGTADLLLVAVIAWALQKRVDNALYWSVIAGLLVAIVSALPLGAAAVGYTLSAAFAMFLRQRVWKLPLLAMFLATFVGTLLTHAINLVVLRFAGYPLPIFDSFNLVTLPSLIINLLVAIPAFAIFSDLARWLYPEPLEV
jgi:rod shape-determining protein MreD